MSKYEVGIEKRYINDPITRFTQGEYYWSVTGYDSAERYVGNARRTGWARTLKSAKRRALRAVLRSEGIIGDGTTFGVKFKLEGSAEELKKLLR